MSGPLKGEAVAAPRGTGAAPGGPVSATDVSRLHQAALLMLPALVVPVMYMVFQIAVALHGPRLGHMWGFLIYWGLFCVGVPAWVLGVRPEARTRVRRLFQRAPEGLIRVPWLEAERLLLLVPPAVLLFGAGFGLFPVRPQIALGMLAHATGYAVLNGPLEELLWRGTYLFAFPRSFLLGGVVPAAGFALFRLALLPLHEARFPGGLLGLLGVTFVLGLLYGWVARRTSSIRGVSISHAVLDFLTLTLAWSFFG